MPEKPPEKKKNDQALQADKAKWIRQVALKILDLHYLTKSERAKLVVQFSAELTQTKERMARKYVAWATLLIEKSGSRPVEERVSQSENRLDDQYQKCDDASDRRTAIAAIREINELFGLHEPKKITQKVEIVGTVVLHDMAGEFDDSVKKRKGKKK